MTRYRDNGLRAARAMLANDRAELSRSLHLYRAEALPGMRSYFRANVLNAIMHVRCSLVSVKRWEAV